MGQRRPRSVLATGLSAFIALSLIAAISGAVMAHAAREGSVGGQASSSLTVTVSDALQFTLSNYEVTPGDNVSVTLEQLGSQPHTFTLSAIANYQFSTTANDTTSLLNFFKTHAPLVNISVGGTPGDRATANFTAPAYGLYEFVCLSPGHFQSGMWGLLGSGEEGSGGSTDTGPGAAVFIIGGVIVSLVVVAIVLGFVVGQRRGAVHEMPPERLGYSEKPEDPATPKH